MNDIDVAWDTPRTRREAIYRQWRQSRLGRVVHWTLQRRMRLWAFLAVVSMLDVLVDVLRLPRLCVWVARMLYSGAMLASVVFATATYWLYRRIRDVG